MVLNQQLIWQLGSQNVKSQVVKSIQQKGEFFVIDSATFETIVNCGWNIADAINVTTER